MNSSRRLTVLLVVSAAFSLLLTWVVVDFSSESGKLAIPPEYDDSHSMVEGAVRLLTLQREGVAAAWREYLARPPHSFLHYYFASLCFALFGIGAPVVYWASVIFLFAGVAGLAVMLPSIPLIRSLPLLGGFVCLPVAFNVIFDFRSECAMAALLFAACCAVIRSAWSPVRSYAWAAAAGGLFAVCLGIKPAMFPYVLGMAFCSVILWLASGVIQGGGRWRTALGGSAVAWGIMGVPFSFHYVINAEQIFGYILNNAFASDFWKQHGTFAEQLVFHFLGFPGKLHLGSFAIPLLVISVTTTGAALIFRRAGDPDLRRYLVSCAFLAAAAYAGVAINSMNQNYFGMTFHLLLGASAILGVAFAASLMPRIPGHLLCLAAGGLALAGWKVPISQDYVTATKRLGGEDALAWRREGPRKVYEAIRADWNADGIPAVWIAAYGWIDGNTIAWEAVRDRLGWKMWNYYERPPAGDELFPKWPDFIVAPDAGVMGTIELPLTKQLPKIAQAAQSDPDMRLVASFSDPKGKVIRVYRRAAPKLND